jgi:hypothetical protein
LTYKEFTAAYGAASLRIADDHPLFGVRLDTLVNKLAPVPQTGVKRIFFRLPAGFL